MTETNGPDSDLGTQSLRKERLLTIGLVVVIAIVLLLSIGLLSFGKIYQYSVEPSEIESSYEIKRHSGNAFALFSRVFVFSDEAVYEVSSPGYSSETVTFLHESDQRVFFIKLNPLPGYLSVTVSDEFPVSIQINDEVQSQLERIELEQGRHIVAVMRDDTKLDAYALDIAGFGTSQEIFVDLTAYQAFLRIATKPRTATIKLDDTTLGQGTFEGGVPAVSGQLHIAAAGFDAEIIDIVLKPGEILDLATVELSPSLITTTIETSPTNASVLLDGSFVGESTASFTLRPGRSYQLVVRKPGFQEHKAVLTPEIGKNISRNIDFEQTTIRINVQATPNATILVNGIQKGVTPLALDVYPGDTLEAQSEGLTSQSKIVSDEHGSDQSIAFELLEPVTHAYHFSPERDTVTGGLEIVRFPPVRFQKSIGSDTDEMMTIEITRPFYLGATEVTIDAYRLFQSSVNGPGKHPITDISWTDAVKFCNWLSAQHGLQPFYHITPNDVVDDIDLTSLGFRLPTESEWEAGAGFNWRSDVVLEPFEWGQSKTIPIAFGNLAGREAAEIRTRYFDAFMDNHEAKAPVASYLPNANGLYDITGNVSEWTHDYFQIRRETKGGPNYLGPRTGFANVVKGSNFDTDAIEEVAINYREFETGKRSTVGFRVARWIY